MAGYSGTPLPKKLGMLPGTTVLFDGGTLDIPDITIAKKPGKDVDVVHLFTKSAAELARKLADYRKRLRDDAVVWVSWPKKASKVPTDITEDVIREICLPMGWVDIKVCAVDETWSGLKLVVRKGVRASRPHPPGVSPGGTARRHGRAGRPHSASASTKGTSRAASQTPPHPRPTKCSRRT